MAKVNVDWNNLGFAYQPISQRYVANFKDGKWGEGHLTDDANVTINECAGILQYCQESSRASRPTRRRTAASSRSVRT